MMEKNFTIEIDDNLIDLINNLEAKIVADGDAYQLPIEWMFDPSGYHATGTGADKSYGVSVGTNIDGTDWVSVTHRVNASADSRWEIHPMDCRYSSQVVF
jgi:hypothetical protein